MTSASFIKKTTSHSPLVQSYVLIVNPQVRKTDLRVIEKKQTPRFPMKRQPTLSILLKFQSMFS